MNIAQYRHAVDQMRKNVLMALNKDTDLRANEVPSGFKALKASCTGIITHTSTILGVNSFRGIGFFFSNTKGLWVVGVPSMAARISLWSSWDTNKRHATHMNKSCF